MALTEPYRVCGRVVTRRFRGEVLPVPPAELPGLWKTVVSLFHRRRTPYDVDRLHGRLLLGRDRLWVAVVDDPARPLRGVIVTSVANRPPTQSKRFQPVRSLTVHIANGISIDAWIDSAIERITQYGLGEGCRQLFVQCRKGWHEYAKRFYGRGWETIGIGRDRPTPGGGSRFRNRVGHFRILVPDGPRMRYDSAWYTPTVRSEVNRGQLSQ